MTVYTVRLPWLARFVLLALLTVADAPVPALAHRQHAAVDHLFG